mmetsp:Transcript_103793/g.334652  ORF Transcript_103793/g.334652 Transcript_103793/m.334652 type:complete len:866 (+) Transcript_103793:78-2675(+)
MVSPAHMSPTNFVLCCGRQRQAASSEGGSDHRSESRQPLLNEETAEIRDGQDILQFSTPIFFGDESDQQVELGVMRLGQGVGRASCRWATQDGSAKAGDQYTAAAGEVVFEDGDTENKYIYIELEDDDQWHATNEFKVKLSSPEGCTLGNYLHTVRVKVMDNDLFPSGRYPEVAQGRDALDRVSGIGLFSQYVLLNFEQQGMAWRTLLTLLLDQMYPANILLQRWMGLYIVDVVFNIKDEETLKQLVFTSDRLSEAFVMAALYVLPMIPLHAWDYFKLELDIQGRSKAMLRKNLTRRYLNYSEESRGLVDSAKMMVALTDNARDCAAGYCAVLDLVQSMGTVMMLILFTLHSNPDAWWLAVVMPAVMLLYVFLRVCVLPAPTDSLPFKSALINFVNEMLANYRLIIGYCQRPKINEQMAARVSAYRRSQVPASQIAKNDEYFPTWLGNSFACIYILLEAPGVLQGREAGGHHGRGEGHVSLGTFLATIAVVKDVADAFAILYIVYLTVVNTFDPMRDLAFCLNLPTDLKWWSSVNQMRRKRTREAREERRELKGAVRFPVDTIPLRISGVCFRYHPEEPHILKDVTLAADQGSIVAVLGGHASGKDTLMQVLGHTLFATSGEVFVPGHLRLLQVTRDTMLFETWSIWENLTFGLGTSRISPDKVEAVLEELHMPKTLQLVRENRRAAAEAEAARAQGDAGEAEETLALQEQEGPNHWIDSINGSEKAKLNLARALLANPEVLILHMPFVHYDREMQEKVKGVLRMHRDERGIGQPEADRELRRPRSVFYSAMDLEEIEGAEVVWEINSKTKEVKAQTVAEVKAAAATEEAAGDAEAENSWEPTENSRAEGTPPSGPEAAGTAEGA